MIMVSLRSRPIWERSCHRVSRWVVEEIEWTDLDIIALVIITTFAEKPVVNHTMDIELVK